MNSEAFNQLVGHSRAGLVGDRYELGEELGRGAFGQVYKGTDVKTGEVVAIKEISLSGMSHDRLKDIMLEIDLLKNLDHDNIVKYLGFYKTRSHLDILLEYMEQGALSQLIKRDKWGVLPEPMISAFISQVLAGLQYLHGQGVVHRDIKGANILLGAEGQVKLADFGVATQGDAPENTDFDPVGTPYWMAPEVIEMTGSTAPSDIWSVGCTVIELFTGSPPYFDLQPMSALYRIVQDAEVPLPEGATRELRAFLKRCFQKDPQDRPSAAELLQDKWLVSSRKTLRMSWRKSANLARKGLKPQAAHRTLSSVVERMLETRGDRGAGGEGADGAGLPPLPQARQDVQAATRTEESAEPRNVSDVQLQVPPELDVSTSEAEPAAQRTLQGMHSHEGLEPIQERAFGTPPGHAAANATPMLASVIHTHGAPSTLPPAARLDAVLNDLVQRHANASPASLDGGGGSSHDGTRAATPLSSQPSPQPNASEPSALRVSAGLALGVARSASASPARQGEDPDYEKVRQGQQELRRLVTVLHNTQQRGTAGSLGEACRSIQLMVENTPDAKQWFLAQAGIITLMEMLQQPDTGLLAAAMQLLNSVVADDTPVLESLCLVGIVPIVNSLAAPQHSAALRGLAATFVERLCSTSAHTVQMFVACGGLSVLVQLLDSDYRADDHLTAVGLASIWSVLLVHGPTPVNHYCRLLSRAALMPHLLASLAAMIAAARACGHTGDAVADAPTARDGAPANGDMAPPAAMAGIREHLDSVCDLIVVLSHSDSIVKAAVAHPETFRKLLVLIEDLPGPLLAKALQAVRSLTEDPQAVRHIQEAGGVPALVDLLRRGASRSNVALSPEMQLPLIEALHNVCKVNKQRQAEAAAAGITPILCHLATTLAPASAAAPAAAAARPRSPVDVQTAARTRSLCISLLCALVHSNSKTRAELWQCQGLDLFIDLLPETEWQRQAMEALSVWLQEDTPRIEPKLLVKRNVAVVVAMFRDAQRAQERLLRPFRDMLMCSPKLSAAFGTQSELPAILLAKLSGANAFLTTCLLDVIQCLYESHPRPKEFILKFRLESHLEQVRKRHENAIKVVDKCSALMRAIQVNSVL